MAKLSMQLEADVPQERVTRTQRVQARQEQIKSELEAKRLKEAQDKLSKANYDNYEQVYNSIDPKYRTGYLSPSELKQTPGYIQYKQDQADAGYVQSLISYASKMDRGKPFAYSVGNNCDLP